MARQSVIVDVMNDNENYNDNKGDDGTCPTCSETTEGGMSTPVIVSVVVVIICTCVVAFTVLQNMFAQRQQDMCFDMLNVCVHGKRHT